MANECKHGVIQGGWCRSCAEEQEREIDESIRQDREARQRAAEDEERWDEVNDVIDLLPGPFDKK